MEELTLKDYADLARKHLSDKAGSTVNLTLHGHSFTAKRNSDGTLTVCNLEHQAKTPTDQRLRVLVKNKRV